MNSLLNANVNITFFCCRLNAGHNEHKLSDKRQFGMNKRAFTSTTENYEQKTELLYLCGIMN